MTEIVFLQTELVAPSRKIKKMMTYLILSANKLLN